MSEGRDIAGRFTKGNAAAAGHRNPNARRVQLFYNALINAVSVNDIEFVVRKLIKKARSGDLAAIRELLDRTIGKTEKIALELQHEDESKVIRFLFGVPQELLAAKKDQRTKNLPQNGIPLPIVKTEN
jgi:hypothetical protein